MSILHQTTTPHKHTTHTCTYTHMYIHTHRRMAITKIIVYKFEQNEILQYSVQVMK